MARNTAGHSLAERFRERLAVLNLAFTPVPVVVAVSGGRDSMTLLHLLRFRIGDAQLKFVVAHLDHAMRPGSEEDLSWLQGVCRAWSIPLRSERLAEAPASEDKARIARYRFLRRIADEEGSEFILTAHHADDQAETVLFRILRGTGLHGLRGIPERSASGLVRPLLPFWGDEVEEYARANRLTWREDLTNRSFAPSRNQIRLKLLPEVEASFAPAARRSLVALAGEAAEVEAAMKRQVEEAERSVVTRDGEAFLLAREALLRYDSATASRLLRMLLRRFGTVLGGAGTRSALQFISKAQSGRTFSIPGGPILRVEFDRVRVERAVDQGQDRPAFVPFLERGESWSGPASISGAEYMVTAEASPGPGATRDIELSWSTVLKMERSQFPLQIRGWRPGDRVRTLGGTKTLKKLFLECRVPRAERHRLPVVSESSGAIVWVAGLDRPLVSAPVPGAETLLLTITNV
ncbi:tRNA lysidine(34) synthetase TilS [soil metagenome]